MGMFLGLHSGIPLGLPAEFSRTSSGDCTSDAFRNFYSTIYNLGVPPGITRDSTKCSFRNLTQSSLTVCSTDYSITSFWDSPRTSMSSIGNTPGGLPHECLQEFVQKFLQKFLLGFQSGIPPELFQYFPWDSFISFSKKSSDFFKRFFKDSSICFANISSGDFFGYSSRNSIKVSSRVFSRIISRNIFKGLCRASSRIFFLHCGIPLRISLRLAPEVSPRILPALTPGIRPGVPPGIPPEIIPGTLPLRKPPRLAPWSIPAITTGLLSEIPPTFPTRVSPGICYEIPPEDPAETRFLKAFAWEFFQGHKLRNASRFLQSFFQNCIEGLFLWLHSGFSQVFPAEFSQTSSGDSTKDASRSLYSTRIRFLQVFFQVCSRDYSITSFWDSPRTSISSTGITHFF